MSQCLPEGPFDLAVTHFFLDTLNCRDAEAVIFKVNALLPPAAGWLVSEFQEPPDDFRRCMPACGCARCTFLFLTTGLRVSELPPYREFWNAAGFAEIEHRERRFGLIRSKSGEESLSPAISTQSALIRDPCARDPPENLIVHHHVHASGQHARREQALGQVLQAVAALKTQRRHRAR